MGKPSWRRSQVVYNTSNLNPGDWVQIALQGDTTGLSTGRYPWQIAITNGTKYFRPNWTAQGSTVGELIRQMTQQGLRFGPAVSGDESYYTSLHRSMVDYDIGINQLTATAPRR